MREWVQKYPFARESGSKNLPGLPYEQMSRAVRLRLRLEMVAQAFSHQLRGALTRESENGVGFNLAPVAVGAGAIAYFQAPSEPLLAGPLAGLIVFGVIAASMRDHGAGRFLVMAMALFMGGMLAAKFEVWHSQTPQIERQMTVEYQGLVLAIDQNRRGSPRFLTRPLKIGELEKDQIPRFVRLSAASEGATVALGDLVSGTVRLSPVSGPVLPGGYDFRFHAWMNGLGGSGFFLGAPVSDSGFWNSFSVFDRITVGINSFRYWVRDRVYGSMTGKHSAIAVALLIGDKSGIDHASQEFLRETGLAHILAISGLHMALVTLSAIWILRLIAASFPSLSLSYPTKKWAVAIGFSFATIYLLLSGGGVATQRAWIMLSVMLFAVLTDRKALTLRNVAIAALVILIYKPSSLYSPGFQMSFAAVVSLVSGYEALNRSRWLQNRREKLAKAGLIRSSLNSFIGYLSGLAFTSLLAGTATSFVAAWHFYRIAPLGLFANLLAMPIFGVFIMPFVMLSLIAMPLGYDKLFLVVVELGVDWVLLIAQVFAEHSPSGVVGLQSPIMICLFAISLIFISVLRSALRLLGLLPLLAMFWLHQPADPMVIFSENGRAVGLPEEGALKLIRPKSNRFVTDIWSKAWTNGETSEVETKTDSCSRDRCIIMLRDGTQIHVVYKPELLLSSCEQADILAAPRLWWVNCRERQPELVLKRGDFEQYGSHAIYRASTFQKGWFEWGSQSADQASVRFIVRSGLPDRNRPWSRRVRQK